MTYGLSIGTEVGDLEWPRQRDACRRELSLRQLRFLFTTCTYWVRQCLRYTIFSKCQKFQPTTHCISHTSSVIVQSCIFSRPRGRGQNSLWCDVSWTLQCTCEQIKRKETEVAESSAQIGYDCERQIDGLSRYCIIYNGTESKTDADIFCVVRYTSSTS